MSDKKQPGPEYLLPMKWIVSLFKAITFDEWQGTADGVAVMWTKHLLSLGDYRIAIHKFVRSDEEGCFHTHPATALRIVLAGGYVEQLGDGTERTIAPLHVGLVRPELEHRIARLLDGRSSWTLWIRGPKVASVSIRGCT